MPKPVAESPSPDPYTGWKTYKNPTYEFAIRFPKEWYVRQYEDYAATFLLTDPQIREASVSSIRVRFNVQSEPVDLATFEKIYDLNPGESLNEQLDVRSKITKVRNFELNGHRAVEYTIDRTFTALEGPKTEYSHIYEIEKDNSILKFLSSATTREEQLRGDGIFQKMLTSFNF